jgi:hypothetical protein
LTALKGLFPLSHFWGAFCDAEAEEGNITNKNNTFDWVTFCDRRIIDVEDDHGNKKRPECNERYYISSAIT